MRMLCFSSCLLLLATLAVAQPPVSGDWPMLGRTPSRNLVCPSAKNLPAEWTIEAGKQQNIKWVAQLGTVSYGVPVVAGGRVFVGTNNGTPRDPAIKGQQGVLMCFDENTGKFLWQAVHPMPPPDVAREALSDGICSSPAVEGDRLYYTTAACVLVCADAATGKSIWQLDMMKELHVYPSYLCNCSPLIVGDLVYVVTGNGVDGEGKLPAPQAPSFVAVSKKDGKLVWQSALPGTKIIDGQWSNPAYAMVKGKGQVIFPGGDAYLYGLEPLTGEMIWKFNCNVPKADAKNGKPQRNYIIATPVVHDEKVYVGVGVYPENPSPTRVGHFWCVDLSKKGDVSPVNENLDPKAPENKDSALVWHYGGYVNPRPKVGRDAVLGPTMSTCAIQDNLVYLPEMAGYLHCLDARTGQHYWEHDFKSEVWGSPLVADGKIYQGVVDGVVYVFAAAKEKKLLQENDLAEPVESTPVAAHDVLYVMTKSKLYAIGKK